MVVFLRFNHRHFQKGALPAWTAQDATLSHRLEVMKDLCQVVLTLDIVDGEGHLENLFEPFRV